MKTKLFLMLWLVAMLPASCKKSGPDSIIVSVMADNTDKLLLKPNIADITEILDISNNRWSGLTVRLQPVTDLDYNSVLGAKLVSANKIISNPYERDIEIGAFKQKLAKSIEELNEDTVVKARSSIYKVLIDEANKLASLSNATKYMLVYSDLAQNTDDFFSIYSKTDKAALITNTDIIRKKFLDSKYINDLHGLTVFLVFKPKNHLDNENFALMSALFKSIFEYQGAKVNIGASPFLN